MSPFIACLYMASAASLSIGVLAGVAWWRRRDLRHYGLFSLLALAAGLMSLMEPGFYQASTAEAYARWLWWNVTFAIVFLASFAWFLVSYTRVARRRLAWIITAILGVDFVIQLFSPYSLLYSEITSLATATLPWGERLSLAVGAPTVLRPLAEAPGLLLGVLYADAAIRMWRDGRRRELTLLSVAFVPYFVLFSLWGPLVDLGLVAAPYLASFGFLFVVLVIGGELSSDVARASRLAGEVAARERRWVTLVRNVHLAVVRVDAEGTIVDVNPFFCELMGEESADLRGTRLVDFTPEESRPEAAERFAVVLEGGAAPPVQRTLIDKFGGRHTLLWSAVAVHAEDGAPTGAITVGSDITERIEAEAARDHALVELRALKEQLEAENVYLRQEIQTSHGFDEIIGESDVLKYVLHRVNQVADTDATVLVEGETGVGKELVARAVHTRSRRAAGPFVTVNCATLPSSLIESELFGHEKGAFTGAAERRKGRFEVADGGTLFLDEVAEIPLEVQGKLLRVLQEGEFERVGSSTTNRVDVRVVAATNRSLSKEVEVGRFREDLYYRLVVYPVTVPPLRDRRDDIPLLVHHFVRRMAEARGRDVREIPGSLLAELAAYDWPGNVRELQNVLERAIIVSTDGVLRLPERLMPPSGIGTTRPAGSSRLATLAAVEQQHIQAVLEACCGQVAGAGGAAEILGLHPNTLRSRMKRLGISSRSTSRASR